MELFTADWVHVGRTFVQRGAVLVDDDGRVVAAGPRNEVEAPVDGPVGRRAFMGRALMPGTISAHSHCFQTFLRGPGDHPRSFQDWVERYLYPLVQRLDEDSLEAAALLCFHQMLRAGITSVGEFHYVHNAHETYAPDSEALAHRVIRAARRVGLRIAFLRTIYDTSKREGQRRFAEAPADAIARTRDLAAAYADDPFVTVMPAPHSLHGASEDAIRQSAALAAELDTPWHIHLAEQQEDVPFAQERYGKTPLEVLDGWGVLDRRTVLVHGIWLSEAERALLAEKGRGLVTNPTTNMALGDGIAPLAELLAAGVPVGVGTDMNGTPNAFLEMRTAELLQRVHALRMGVLSTTRAETPDPQQVLDTGTVHAAHLLGLEAGALAPGCWADMITLDLTDPSLLPASFLGGDALLSVLTSTLVAETAVKDAFVAGKQVLADGKVLGIPQADLAESVRRARALSA